MLNKEEMKKLEDLIAMMREVMPNDYSALQTLMGQKNQWEENNLDILKLTLSLEANVENNKKIKSIKEILVPINEFECQPFVKISYYDQPPKLMHFQGNWKVIAELRSLMKSKNAVRETAFRTQKINSIPWKNRSIEEIYFPEDSRIYKQVHSMFSHLLNTLISSMPTAQTLLFISAGCGDGEELTVIKKNTKLTNKEIALGGFDINPKNVATAQSIHKEGVFIKGDLQNLSSCIHEIKNSLKISPDHVVLICSGIFQKAVISGTREALQIVQQAFEDVDIVLIGSLQENLITNRMAKAMGFVVEECPLRIPDLKVENSILALTKQLPEQRLAYLTKRNQKRQVAFNRPVIDLSMSATLLRDLKLILEKDHLRLSQAEQLDLSWGNTKSPEELVNFILNYMPNLKEIFISNKEPWAEEFIKILKAREVSYALIIRTDNINAFEVPETSITTARLLRMYENLPSDTPLFFKKASDEVKPSPQASKASLLQYQ